MNMDLRHVDSGSTIPQGAATGSSASKLNTTGNDCLIGLSARHAHGGFRPRRPHRLVHFRQTVMSSHPSRAAGNHENWREKVGKPPFRGATHLSLNLLTLMALMAIGPIVDSNWASGRMGRVTSHPDPPPQRVHLKTSAAERYGSTIFICCSFMRPPRTLNSDRAPAISFRSSVVRSRLLDSMFS
jgi:hypothetical protein